MNVAGSKIAFIGTGVMGASMAGHLQKAGAQLTVYNRSPEKATALLSAGASWAATPAEAAKGANLVFSMVGYPADVEAIYFGPQGILAGATAGTILVDHTTSDPALAKRIAEAAAARGLPSLDAPVSGGDLGARSASLTIMVGGDQAAFDAVLPFFEVMGKTVILQGPPGSGQHTKMANQIAIAGTLAASVEAIIYAEKAGLEPRRVLSSIGGGSAQSWQLQNMVPRMLDGNFEPGFYSKHFLKDLRIALNAAKAMPVKLPVLELAERFFTQMAEQGYQDKGTHALYLLYKDGVL
ncbi:MAG: oxidoreductase [Spirochaetes bacterium GWD1_61_31]|nr:MAG: oxidoreductase [Spirochaetes bacterium GWB1_60_80]OHD31841.1 MAG: oxidoreductase [Spirochaetes bacterium GWC1_61_12]OHD40063.1 MAG: oxidoreductase [Spirochaetes bacterium GWD1_61_31]OHD58432.1 MAG: oxidoreductase [Spirochaetes bacterium GWF1_60_12]HAW85414.1 oxidoreductase [Spirochaetaceae bacterium]